MGDAYIYIKATIVEEVIIFNCKNTNQLYNV